MTPEAIKQQAARLKRASKQTPLLLSAHSGQGMPEALRALLRSSTRPAASEAIGAARSQPGSPRRRGGGRDTPRPGASGLTPAAC